VAGEGRGQGRASRVEATTGIEPVDHSERLRPAPALRPTPPAGRCPVAALILHPGTAAAQCNPPPPTRVACRREDPQDPAATISRQRQRASVENRPAGSSQMIPTVRARHFGGGRRRQAEPTARGKARPGRVRVSEPTAIPDTPLQTDVGVLLPFTGGSAPQTSRTLPSPPDADTATTRCGGATGGSVRMCKTHRKGKRTNPKQATRRRARDPGMSGFPRGATAPRP
jgi:hypothetical protein